MFEEIRLRGESIRPTTHPQIVVTEAPQPDAGVVASWLTLARRPADGALARTALHELVADYRIAAAESPEDAAPDVARVGVLLDATV